MLDDHDRAVLRDIEAELTRHDPAFAARMRPERRQGCAPAVFVLCVTMYVVTPLVVLLFGWTGVLVACAVVAAGSAAVVLRRPPR